MEKTIIRGIATRDGYTLFRVTAAFEQLLGILQASRIPLRFFRKRATRFASSAKERRLRRFAESLKAHLLPFEEVEKVSMVSPSEMACPVRQMYRPVFSRSSAKPERPCTSFAQCAVRDGMRPSSSLEEVAKRAHNRLVEREI